MHTLNAAARGHLRDILTAERAALLLSVSSLNRDDATLVESQASGENRPRGEGEGDSVAVERHLVAQLGARARTALEEIDEALVRLENGSYGSCERCAGPIPLERLEVRPRTTVCVPCASRR